MTPFRCSYELDQRPNPDLVRLNEQMYRSLPVALGADAEMPVDEYGLPDAVRYYLVYVASLMYGAADAALTLVLHNLGREARVFQRQMFECLIRASYFVENPDRARVALVATAFRELELLDELGYDTKSERYTRIERAARQLEADFPEAKTYDEPGLKRLLKNAGLERMYALNYRVESQMAHASFVGTGAVFTEDGVSFDSRESLPNYVIANTTVSLLAFFDLLSKAVSIDASVPLAEFKARWAGLQDVIEQ